MKVALLLIFHDPFSMYYEAFSRQLDYLQTIYSEVIITVSDKTVSEYQEFLEPKNIRYKIIPAQGAGEARRKVVELGLESCCDYFHYCDGDRMMTWSTEHSSELIEIQEFFTKVDYAILGRTDEAFNSHPIAWCETEEITNKVASKVIGKNLDITAGSCAFDRVIAKEIVNTSVAKLTDGEWLMIAYRMNKSIACLKVNGLKYLHKYNRVNTEVDEVMEYAGRVKLSYIITESIVKVLKTM